MERLGIEMCKDFALIKEKEQIKRTESGIYLQSIKWYRYYDVIESNIDDIVNGDVVLIEIGKGTPHIINGEMYLVYHKDNIMAKIID